MAVKHCSHFSSALVVHSSLTASDGVRCFWVQQPVSSTFKLVLQSSAYIELGMVVMFVAWTITSSQFEKNPNNMAAGYPQVAFVWLFGVFYSLAWSGLLVAYALEILPYKLRAKGLMIMNLTVQAALVLGK